MVSQATKDGFKPGEDAARYDAVSAGVHEHEHILRPIVERMLLVAGLKPGEHLLDIGCGTGFTTNRAARRLGASGKAVGLDLSEEMLKYARADAERKHLVPSTEYHAGDAESLPFEDASFDCCVSLYTFMHLPDPERCAAEVFRVLKPAGRVVIGVGSRAPLTSFRGWIERLSRVPEYLGRRRELVLTAPHLLNSLVRKHFDIPDSKAVVPARWQKPLKALPRLLERVGFSKIRLDWEGQVIAYSDPIEFWELQTTFSSFARQRLVAAPAEKVETIKREFLDRCDSVLGCGGRLVYPQAALFAQGRRP